MPVPQTPTRRHDDEALRRRTSISLLGFVDPYAPPPDCYRSLAGPQLVDTDRQPVIGEG